MNPGPKRAVTMRAAPLAGSELRQRVEGLGTSLADRLGALLAALPRRAVGPQRLSEALGITTVTASRLLKALSQSDPVAVLQLLPGPKPLQEIVDAARALGTAAPECDRASLAVEEFGELIRTYAGDRGALRAMLSAWLPEDRREFEAQRRQAIFKALTELEGVSSDFQVDTILITPSATAGLLDIVSVKAVVGIDRIRPDAVVRLATQRIATPNSDENLQGSPRAPSNLAGEPALDGLHTVRLDNFCAAPPAPLEARTYGDCVQYSLGPTGFGPASKVDLVVAEVNRAELPRRDPASAKPTWFFANPEMPTRKLQFDLLVHDELFGGQGPELSIYDTSTMGPASPADPARDLDRRNSHDPAQVLGPGLSRVRVLEFPRYTQLLEHVFEQLALPAERFNIYRFSQTYPLVGRQVTFTFNGRAARAAAT